MSTLAEEINLTKDEIENFINHTESFKGSYFWKPPMSADSRRNYEKRIR